MPRKHEDDEQDRDDEDRPRSKGDRHDDEAFEEEDRPVSKRRRPDEDDDSDDEEDDRRRSVRKKGTLDRDSLRSVAWFQKGILICILIYLGLTVGGFFVPAELKWAVGIIALPVIIGATVFVFLLAMKVYHPAVGILLALLTLVPCVGLLVLLIINGKATAILRQHEIRVGLLGADMSDI